MNYQEMRELAGVAIEELIDNEDTEIFYNPVSAHDHHAMMEVAENSGLEIIEAWYGKLLVCLS